MSAKIKERRGKKGSKLKAMKDERVDEVQQRRLLVQVLEMQIAVGEREASLRSRQLERGVWGDGKRDKLSRKVRSGASFLDSRSSRLQVLFRQEQMTYLLLAPPLTTPVKDSGRSPAPCALPPRLASPPLCLLLSRRTPSP